MSNDEAAYQASDDFAAAIIARTGEIEAFNRNVIGPANERLHPNEPVFSSAGAWEPRCDGRCVGFNDGADDVPDGLSRAQTRRQLVPKRSKAGKAWQAEIDALNERPKLAPVFQEFGVEFSVFRGNSVTSPAMRMDDETGQVWFRYARAPRESEHLIPRKLSEYHALNERLDAAAV
jgi:hypothetical protein